MYLAVLLGWIDLNESEANKKIRNIYLLLIEEELRRLQVKKYSGYYEYITICQPENEEFIDFYSEEMAYLYKNKCELIRLINNSPILKK